MAHQISGPDVAARAPDDGLEMIERHIEQQDSNLLKGTQALQATIDALAELQTPDQIVPRVLQIVADQFQATSCAFYENDSSSRLWLRYWHFDGRTLLPDELLQLDPERFALLVPSLAQGFTVPDSYLGKPIAEVTYPVVLNHRLGTPVTEFDRFMADFGWDLELNIGVPVGRVRASTLCIHRGHRHPFGADEIALAEFLAKQLGLAMQTARLVEQVRESAVVREQLAAAEQRVSALAKANEVMQLTIDTVATMDELDRFVPAALRLAATAFGSQQALFYTQPLTQPIRLRYWLRGDDVLNPAEILQLEGPDPAVLRILVEGFEVPDSHVGAPARQRYRAAVVDHVRGSAVPEFDRFSCDNGMEVELNVPLLVGEIAEGAMLFFRGPDETFSASEIALAEALGKQIALAMQASRVAEAARSAAIALEREAAAERKIAELAKANAALRRGVERISDENSLDSILGSFLAETISALDANGGALLLRVPVSECTFGVAAVYEGRTISRDEIEADPYLSSYVELSASDPAGIFTALAKGDTPSILVSSLRETVPLAYAYHRKRGDTIVWHAPLRLRDSLIGFLGLTRRDPSPPDDAVWELVKALTQQLVLALQLTRLAEEARLKTIAAEREAAAETARESAGAGEPGATVDH